MKWLLEAYTNSRTYGTLAYLLLSLPLGVFGYVVVVSGLALGLGLLVTLVGIPILVLTLLFVREYASMQRGIAWSMLQAPLPRRAAQRAESEGIYWQRLGELITSPKTWRELVYVLVSLPLGVIGFSLAVTLIALMFAGLAQPIVVAAGVDARIGTWVIDTFEESLVYLPVSLLFLLVGPRILLGIGSVAGRIVTWFLGHIGVDELKRAITQSLARDGELDAFAILDQLQLRFGPGSHPSPTQIQATLLALESTGHVRSAPSVSGLRYRLTE